MNKRELREFRNECRRRLREKDRNKTNQLNIHPQNSYEHEKKKFEICWELEQEGKKYITEARFKDRDIRADIFVLDDDEIHEVETTQYELEERKREYSGIDTFVWPLWDSETECWKFCS